MWNLLAEGMPWRCRTNYMHCHFISLIPYHLTLEMNWKKETSNFGKIFNPKLSWRAMCLVVSGFSWELMQIFQSLPQAAVLAATSSMASSGKDCCSLEQQPWSLSATQKPKQAPGAGSHKCPSWCTMLFVPFLSYMGETQPEFSAETAHFVVPVTSKGVSSRKSFSGHPPNTFIWWQISCEKRLLRNSLISSSFGVVWKEGLFCWDNFKDLSFNGLMDMAENYIEPVKRHYAENVKMCRQLLIFLCSDSYRKNTNTVFQSELTIWFLKALQNF